MFCVSGVPGNDGERADSESAGSLLPAGLRSMFVVEPGDLLASGRAADVFEAMARSLVDTARTETAASRPR